MQDDAPATRERRDGASLTIEVKDLPGMNMVAATALAALGIVTCDDLLASCRTDEGRRALGERAGIAPASLIRWSQAADLMRIRGLSAEAAESMLGVGCTSVPSLAAGSPARLEQAMRAAPAAPARDVPTADVIADWIEQAARLAPDVKDA